MSKVDQVGGSHYQAEYQHWDWAAETELGYLEANATKYVSRWRKKGGVEDLKKALSYVKKLTNVHIVQTLLPAGCRRLQSEVLRKTFTHGADLSGHDAQIIRALDRWLTVDDLVAAAELIEARIDNPDINHPAPFGWVGEDGGRE